MHYFYLFYMSIDLRYVFFLSVERNCDFVRVKML